MMEWGVGEGGGGGGGGGGGAENFSLENEGRKFSGEGRKCLSPKEAKKDLRIQLHGKNSVGDGPAYPPPPNQDYRTADLFGFVTNDFHPMRKSGFFPRGISFYSDERQPSGCFL